MCIKSLKTKYFLNFVNLKCAFYYVLLLRSVLCRFALLCHYRNKEWTNYSNTEIEVLHCYSFFISHNNSVMFWLEK